MANTLTKESIKNRMMKRMQVLWEIRNIEAVDPIIKLLIESLAAEIFILASELNKIECRILEKLAAALTPNDMLTATPSTAILHARTMETQLIINPEIPFVYRNENFAKKYDLKRINFHPICCTKIINGDIKYIIDSQGCYNNTINMGKECIANTLHRDVILNHKVIIGLDIEDDVTSLQNMSFYLDFPHSDQCTTLLSLLSYSKWLLAEETILVTQGLNGKNNQYQNNFLTIQENINPHKFKKETFPKDIALLFPKDFIANFTKPILWFTVEFPAIFTQDIIQQCSIYINSFPIINISKTHLSHNIDKISTIIPLRKQNSEHFLSIDSVTSNNKEIYTENRQNIYPDNSSGSYSIRFGGCERFNISDSKDYIMRLTHLIQDESIAFSHINKDTLKNNVDELLKQITLLSKKIGNEEEIEIVPYLILETKNKEARDINLSYWLTNGDLVNGIAATSPLESPRDLNLERSSLRLLTRTSGGRKAPNISQKIDIYKYMLTSRNSIITKEDITNYCQATYREYLLETKVSLGYHPGEAPGEGIIRTLDVKVTPSEQLSNIEDNNFSKKLLNDLISRSPETFRYRVIINR